MGIRRNVLTGPYLIAYAVSIYFHLDSIERTPKAMDHRLVLEARL